MNIFVMVWTVLNENIGFPYEFGQMFQLTSKLNHLVSLVFDEYIGLRLFLIDWLIDWPMKILIS